MFGVIDVVIVLVLLGCLVHGLQRGLVGSIGSVAGLVAGGIAAWVAAPPVGALVRDVTARTVLTIVVAVVLVLVGGGVGTRLGSAAGRPLRRTPFGPVDRALGGGAQVVIGAVVVSVIASLAVALGTPVIARPLADSVVTQRIDALTPEPLARAIDGIEAGVATAGASAVGGALLAAPPTR